MFDIDAIIECHREGLRKKDEETIMSQAVDILWNTGMISVEEYIYLSPLMFFRENGEHILSQIKSRNSRWEDPNSLSDIVASYIRTGTAP
jgi:hypothetical protein